MECFHFSCNSWKQTSFEEWTHDLTVFGGILRYPWLQMPGVPSATRSDEASDLSSWGPGPVALGAARSQGARHTDLRCRGGYLETP